MCNFCAATLNLLVYAFSALTTHFCIWCASAESWSQQTALLTPHKQSFAVSTGLTMLLWLPFVHYLMQVHALSLNVPKRCVCVALTAENSSFDQAAANAFY